MIKLKRLLALKGSGLRLISTMAGVLLLAACASAPKPPTAELQAAELAIANAEQARVANYAPVELREARDKLAKARAAVQEEDMVGAKRRAEEALASAELALAKANEAKALEVNEEMKKSTEALKEEMQRNIGVSQ